MKHGSSTSAKLLTFAILAIALFSAHEAQDVFSAERNAPQRPNLVFVFADQMRGSAMGFLGEEPVVTPNLDRLAQQAVVFTQAASNYPVCSPYRAMLMTGQYPHRNGVVGNCLSRTAPYGVELQADAECWSDVLKASGYSLGYIGKWHLEAPYKPYIDCANNRGKQAWNEWTPPQRRHGFSFWYAYNTYDFHMRPLYWDTDADRDEFHYVDQWGPAREADLAIKFIRNEAQRYRQPDRPFALVVSMNPPHTPYSQHPDKYLEPYAKLSDDELSRRPNVPPAGTRWGDYYRSQIRHYYAMITGVDEQFGRIVEALDGAGLADETILVFTSDHGNCLGIHGHQTKNVPEEESMRIPLLIRFPGKLQPKKEDLLISVPDLYPTLLDLMGLSEKTPSSVEGVSHADLLLTGNGRRPTSQLYLWIPCEQPSMGRRGVRTRQHTLVVDHMPGKDKQLLLFDNAADPYQLKNIAQEQPKMVDQLILEELAPWLRQTGDPWLEMKTMRMIRTAVLISVAALVAFPALGADEPAAGKMIKVFPQQAELLPYWLYLPKEYDGNEDKYPVLVFLHGLGERGNGLDRVLAHGPGKLIARGKHFPFIMIAPQCPNDGNLRDRNAKAFWWKAGSIDRVKNIVDHEKERLGRVDEDRVYITGLSMGGFGTYHIVSRHPKTFAAAVPICGHGNGWPGKKAVAHIPFWAFHGDKDGVVKLADQQETVDDLKAAGAKVKFTVYPGVGHNSWTQTYANPELYEWLLAQKRGQGESQE